jgi:hypothetical protein
MERDGSGSMSGRTRDRPKSTNQPSASGLVSAELVRVESGRKPCRRRLIGISIFFPVRVRGICGTITTSSGTWRRESQHLAGVVQPGTGKPLGARHRARAEGGTWPRTGQREVVPHRPPELVEVLDAPGLQLAIAGEAPAPLHRQPVGVSRDPLARIRRRCPQDRPPVAHPHLSTRRPHLMHSTPKARWDPWPMHCAFQGWVLPRGSGTAAVRSAKSSTTGSPAGRRSSTICRFIAMCTPLDSSASKNVQCTVLQRQCDDPRRGGDGRGRSGTD